jgi:hypothetical protein
MKINLDQINKLSSVSIYFFTKQFNFTMITDMFNLLFAKNGVYIIYKNNFATLIDRFDGISYANSELLEITNSSIMQLNCPKPPITIFNKILEMFKYVGKKSGYELVVNVYFDQETEKFEIDIMKQKVSSALADGKYSSYEMDSRYIRYLQIHSHHSMEAKFSATDNEDEKNKINCFYGVVGSIKSQNDNYATVGKSFRIWNGFNRFIEYQLQDIFDIVIEIPEIEISIYKELDKIISTSIKENKQQNLKYQNYAPWNGKLPYQQNFEVQKELDLIDGLEILGELDVVETEEDRISYLTEMVNAH